MHNLLGTLNFGAHFVRGEVGKVRMTPGVVAQFKQRVRGQGLGLVGMATYPESAQKEGGRSVGFGQNIDDGFIITSRAASSLASVEGKGDVRASAVTVGDGVGFEG